MCIRDRCSPRPAPFPPPPPQPLSRPCSAASQVLWGCPTSHNRSSRAYGIAFPERPAPLRVGGQSWDLPVLAHGGSVHALVPLTARGPLATRASATSDSAFRPCDNVGTPNSLISRLNSPACTCPCQRFATPLRVVDA